MKNLTIYSSIRLLGVLLVLTALTQVVSAGSYSYHNKSKGSESATFYIYYTISGSNATVTKLHETLCGGFMTLERHVDAANYHDYSWGGDTDPGCEHVLRYNVGSCPLWNTGRVRRAGFSSLPAFAYSDISTYQYVDSWPDSEGFIHSKGNQP